jgi:arsenite methyltransferase
LKSDSRVKDIFEAWGRDYHADGMESEHWPRAREIFNLIEPSAGHYLEIGVGNGYGLDYMAAHQFARGTCIGMDISESMVERARERTRERSNVALMAGDFLDWDFGNQRFDVIFSMEVFYYFPDIHRGIEKAFSILNPGGTLWVAVNFYEENTGSADWPDRLGAPLRRWSVADYAASFARAGFSDVGHKMIDTPLPTNVHGDAPTLCTFGTRV